MVLSWFKPVNRGINKKNDLKVFEKVFELYDLQTKLYDDSTIMRGGYS